MLFIKWQLPVVTYIFFTNIYLIQNETPGPSELRGKHISNKLAKNKTKKTPHSCKYAQDAKIYLHFFKAGEKWVTIQAHGYNKSKI